MSSSVLQRYTLYRSAGRALHSKIMEKSLREDVLNRAAFLLGIIGGKTILFKNEDETGMLMNFALHDILADGKRSTIEIYRDEVG